MPLKCGERNIGKNISLLEREGYPHRQAVAIALSHLRKCTRSPRIKRKYTKPKYIRGMKKCVINAMVRSTFNNPKAARKAISRALKTCKRKLM